MDSDLQEAVQKLREKLEKAIERVRAEERKSWLSWYDEAKRYWRAGLLSCAQSFEGAIVGPTYMVLDPCKEHIELVKQNGTPKKWFTKDCSCHAVKNWDELERWLGYGFQGMGQPEENQDEEDRKFVRFFLNIMPWINAMRPESWKPRKTYYEDP